jgi:hypothetical protein
MDGPLLANWLITKGTFPPFVAMASIGMISTSTMFATVHFLASATILTHPPIMATEKEEEIQCGF